MILLGTMQSLSEKMAKDIYEPIVISKEVYVGQVSMILDPTNQNVRNEFDDSDINQKRYSCRNILFSMKEDVAKDLLNRGISYKISSKPDYDSRLETCFEVDDYLNIERLLKMCPSMIDFEGAVNRIIQLVYARMRDNKEEEKLAQIKIELEVLIKTAALLEQLKFNEYLTMQDLIRIRDFFLDNRNLYKLAYLFGLERSGQRGALRLSHQKNEMGHLFPKSFFGDLTPDEVFSKLSKYSKLPCDLSKYERHNRAKFMEKYIKGVC